MEEVRPDVFGPWRSFIEAFLEEVLNLLDVWSWVIWTLTLTAVYITNLRVAQSLNETFELLKKLGARRNNLAYLAFLRLFTLGILSWLLGWCIGLVSSQIAFRLAAYAFKGPYATPVLTLTDLMRLLLWTLAVVFGGGIWPLRALLRGKKS